MTKSRLFWPGWLALCTSPNTHIIVSLDEWGSETTQWINAEDIPILRGMRCRCIIIGEDGCASVIEIPMLRDGGACCVHLSQESESSMTKPTNRHIMLIKVVSAGSEAVKMTVGYYSRGAAAWRAHVAGYSAFKLRHQSPQLKSFSRLLYRIRRQSVTPVSRSDDDIYARELGLVIRYATVVFSHK